MTKVLHILHSTSGGAGRAAMRLHSGLLDAGVDSRVICREHHGCVPGVFVVGDDREDSARFRELHHRWDKIADAVFSANRTSISNTVTHVGYPGFDLASLPLVREADILHLHWTPKLLSVRGVEKLLQLGKPTLWTQHDRWPTTPGYHFPACEANYALQDFVTTHVYKSYDLPSLLLEDKRRSFDYSNLEIICLNEESRQEYKEKSIFSRRRIWAMPNAVDTDRFTPSEEQIRRSQRRSIGVEDNDLVLLLLSQDGREKRKGYAHLGEALLGASSFPKLNRALREQRLVIATIGHRDSTDCFPVVRRISLGAISDDTHLARAIGICDALVMPSEQESFSLAVLEALSCGLPVITFQHSGMPAEHIVTFQNGILVPGAPSPRKLAEALELALSPDFPWAEARKNARATAKKFSIENVTEQLLDIYAHALGAPIETLYSKSDEEICVAPAQKLWAPFDPGPSNWLARQAVEPEILKIFAEPAPLKPSAEGNAVDSLDTQPRRDAAATGAALSSDSDANADTDASQVSTSLTSVSLTPKLCLNAISHRSRVNQIIVRNREVGHAVFGPYLELPAGTYEFEATLTLPPGGVSQFVKRQRAILELVYNKDTYLRQIGLKKGIFRNKTVNIRELIDISEELSSIKEGGLELRLWAGGEYECVIETASIKCG